MNTQNEVEPVDPDGSDHNLNTTIEIGHRIREARGAMSQQALADLLNVHVNTIGKLERGAAGLQADLLLQISVATRVSPAWLLLGPSYAKDDLEKGGRNPPPDVEDLVWVPSYGVEASAGNGTPVGDEQVIGRFAFKRGWLARKALKPERLVVITARGDSMEPTVRDGDILLVDRNVQRISADGMYIIERDNELYCKRLQRLFDGGVTIMSDNTRYEPQQLSGETADSLNVTGRVIWIGGER